MSGSDTLQTSTTSSVVTQIGEPPVPPSVEGAPSSSASVPVQTEATFIQLPDTGNEVGYTSGLASFLLIAGVIVFRIARRRHE